LTDFQERLKKAAERGQRSRTEKKKQEVAKALSAEELRGLHTKCRLEISEHIERCLHDLADQFPGFRTETLMGDQGWGTAILRDDVNIRRGDPRRNLYSRLEVAVMPIGEYSLLDLSAKGTVRNKELLRRNHYQHLDEVDLQSFRELIDLWVLEYAELYSAAD